MNDKHESKYTGTLEDFRYFEAITLESFHFLIDEYNFQHVSTRSIAADCKVEYRHDGIVIGVEWEWQYFLIVELGRIATAHDGTSYVEWQDLEHLLAIRCPEKHVNQKKHPDKAELKRVIDAYAGLLREWAKDVLSGDFSIFPQLRILSEESVRRKKKMLGYPDFDAKV